MLRRVQHQKLACGEKDTLVKGAQRLGTSRGTARELTHVFQTGGAVLAADQSTVDAVSDDLADVMPKLKCRRSRSETPSQRLVVPDPSQNLQAMRFAPPLYVPVPTESRRDLVSVPQCTQGDWRQQFKPASLTTSVLKAFIDEDGRQDETLYFSTYIGPGSDGSSQVSMVSLSADYVAEVEKDALHHANIVFSHVSFSDDDVERPVLV